MNAWLGRIGFLTVTGSLFWVLSPSLATMHGQNAYSQQEPAVPSSPSVLQVQSAMLPSGVQQLSIIDSQARSLAVYHIDSTTGKILLKSVRNLQWDLKMEHFNGQAPLPGELRQVQP